MSFRKMQDLLFTTWEPPILRREEGTLLRIRIICFIWPWATRLLMQPKTTRALGWRDGLYWNANLQLKDSKSLWKLLFLYTINKVLIMSISYLFEKDIFLQLINLRHTFELVRSTGPATCMLEYLSYMPKRKDTLKYIYAHNCF